jgi:hypothetical protein
LVEGCRDGRQSKSSSLGNRALFKWLETGDLEDWDEDANPGLDLKHLLDRLGRTFNIGIRNWRRETAVGFDLQ